MTRICSWCKKSMGEKCGNCGSLDVLPLGPEGPFKCLKCSHRWEKGSEGTTHGICIDCYPIAIEKAGIACN